MTKQASFIQHPVLIDDNSNTGDKWLSRSETMAKNPHEFGEVAMQSVDWFWEMDSELRFTYQSERFEEVTGIQINQVIGKTREEAFAGFIDDAQKWQRLGADLNHRNDYSMVWALKRDDGLTKVLRTIGKPFSNQDGDFMGYRGVGIDITESVQIMEALETSKSRFKNFAHIAADWFFELDENLVVSYMSGDIHPPSGRKVSELVGLSSRDTFAGQLDRMGEGESHFAKLEAHQHYETFYEWHRDDGTVMHVHTRGNPFFDENGNFKGYRGCGTDVTEARMAEKLVKESESQFRKIIENVTDIILIADQDGRLSFQNTTIFDLLGYTPEDLEDKRLGDLVVAEDRQQLMADTQQAFDNPGKIVRTIYRCAHKDGSLKVLEATRQMIANTNTNVPEVIIHARDITSQYLAEEALLESEQRLRDFAETAADWFWEQDADYRFTYISGNFPGYRLDNKERFIGKTRQEVSPHIDFGTSKWDKLFDQMNNRLPFNNYEFELTVSDGDSLIVRISGKPTFAPNGEFQGYRGSGIDITESHQLEKQLNFQASHDSLTGLVNRREFENRLSRVIEQSQQDNSSHALCYIDLDQFKVVNDTCGHEAGDELLRQITSILEMKLRKRDTVARLGGDEFGLLLERCDIEKASFVAESVRAAIEAHRFVWSDKSFKVGASMGLIPINQTSGNFSEVLRNADTACYTAKDAGRNRIQIYRSDNYEVAQRHEEMRRIVDITSAFDDERFVLYRQSIINLNPGTDAHNNFSEVLVRMVDIKGELILPEVFLPVAERYNLATQLDTWVVTESLNWLERESAVGKVTNCSINLSGKSIADEKFLAFILETLESTSIDANQICFEITETAAIANLTRATRFINELREKGCYFALDDFGSGLSSFAYLKTLPVDFLKIDGFFMRDILDDRISYEMVKSINDIGHVMGKKTIAEFVESEQVVAVLRKIGVDYVQGYAIAKPIRIPA